MWILLLFGLFVPRVAALVLFFLSSWFVGIFSTWYWPLAGFVFMPYTLLWYSAVAHWYGGSWAFPQILILIIAVVADLSSNGLFSWRR